jgi:hypothetical protein
MKKELRISRANFPGVGNFSWMNFFVNILKKKYDVIIDPVNPEVIIYTNQYYQEGGHDYYTGQMLRGEHDYGDNVKKVFISGEARPDYISRINKSENYYALGYEHIDHERYLRFPTHVLDAFVLHNEGGMFDTPYEWMTQQRNSKEILANKKHFCSIVQLSNNLDRGTFFDIASKKYYIKSSGPWRPTIEPEEGLNPHKYHDYSNKEYMGRIDGLTYRDKVNFFKDSVFNISFQYTLTEYLTQEKIIHAYASNSIPIFYGNPFIEEEGFNPNTFINCHNFENFEHAFEFISEVYEDKSKLIKYFDEPIFVDNKLPIYFNEDYILSFFENIIE